MAQDFGRCRRQFIFDTHAHETYQHLNKRRRLREHRAGKVDCGGKRTGRFDGGTEGREHGERNDELDGKLGRREAAVWNESRMCGGGRLTSRQVQRMRRSEAERKGFRGKII